jgi:hypothetical protein
VDWFCGFRGWFGLRDPSHCSEHKLRDGLQLPGGELLFMWKEWHDGHHTSTNIGPAVLHEVRHRLLQ